MGVGRYMVLAPIATAAGLVPAVVLIDCPRDEPAHFFVHVLDLNGCGLRKGFCRLGVVYEEVGQDYSEKLHRNLLEGEEGGNFDVELEQLVSMVFATVGNPFLVILLTRIHRTTSTNPFTPKNTTPKSISRS